VSLIFERLPELDELVTGVEAMALDATDLGSQRPLLQLLLNTGFGDSYLEGRVDTEVQTDGWQPS